MNTSVFISVIEIGPPYKGSLAGTRRYAYSLIQSLANQGLDIHVVSTNKLPPDDTLFNYKNIHLYRIAPRVERQEGYRKGWGSLKRDNKYFSRKSFEVFQELCMNYKIKLIHTIDLAAISFLKAKKTDKISIPLITSLSNPIIARKIKNSLLKCSDKIIFTNLKSLAKALEQLPESKEKSTIIPLSIDCKKFTQIPTIEQMDAFRDKYDVLIGKQTILILGPFIPRKLQRETVDYFPEILKRNKNAHFLICGDGPTLRDIKNKIINYKLEDYVSITGYIPEEDLHIAYYVSSLLLYPAEGGSFGTPVIEAMASGLPVLAANRAPMNEILEEENLYPIEQKELIIEKVLEILEDKERTEKISFELQKKALKQYDYGVVGKKLMKIYEEILR
ncbi:MAG: glycosyltransferase family 4 protein [Candidatus Heimdallarchaeaceae archaeon]